MSTIKDLEIFKQLKEKNYPEGFIEQIILGYFKALHRLYGLPEKREFVDAVIKSGVNLRFDGDYLVFFDDKKEIERIYARC